MHAGSHYFTFHKHDYLVEIACCAIFLCNRDECDTGIILRRFFQYFHFGVGIDPGGEIVEQQYFRIDGQMQRASIIRCFGLRKGWCLFGNDAV